MVKSVAVVGVGAMGAPIARRLLAADLDVTVLDKREEATRPLREAGAHVAENAADCNRVDVVLLLVATADQVRQTLFAENGLMSALGAEKPPLVAIMGTVGREAVVSFQKELARLDVSLVDAPISGGAVKAEQGTLSVIMGGTEADVEAIRPVMSHLGRKLFHCGPVGSAQLVKIANNVLGDLSTLATAEVFRLLAENGIDVTEACQIFEASSGRNWLSADPDMAAGSYALMTSSRALFDSTVAVVKKDIGMSVDLAEGATGSYPTINALGSLVAELGDATFENWQVAGAVAATDTRDNATANK